MRSDLQSDRDGGSQMRSARPLDFAAHATRIAVFARRSIVPASALHATPQRIGKRSASRGLLRSTRWSCTPCGNVAVVVRHGGPSAIVASRGAPHERSGAMRIAQSRALFAHCVSSRCSLLTFEKPRGYGAARVETPSGAIPVRRAQPLS
jgi:hypothetical protein